MHAKFINAKRIYHKTSVRFPYKYHVTGELAEDINKNIGTYIDDWYSDYDLSPAKKLRWFHNLFDGEAKRFFTKSVKKRTNDFLDSAKIMEEEYRAITRQNFMKDAFKLKYYVWL